MRYRDLLPTMAVRDPPRGRAHVRPLARLLVFLLIFLSAAGGWAYTFQSTGLYHSYNDLASWAATLQSQNPDLVNVVTYGYSAQGRPLVAIDITVNPTAANSTKPDFLFTGGVHAREVVGSEAALALANQLVGGYRAGDPLYQNMLSTRDVWIVPYVNPDGRMTVENGYSVQRKNMNWYQGQGTNDYTRGVDLNRNFPHLWNLASSVVADETYRGPSALSEPEANGIWSLLHQKDKFSNLLCSVDFHSGATTFLTPWSSPTDYAQNQSQIPAAVQQKFATLANTMAGLTGYSTSRLGYDYYGTLSDSLYEEFKSYSMTEELYAGSFIGSYPDDYFSYFNPTDATTRDATLKKAVDSAMYLLSDAAFAVPEPATVLLLAVAWFVLLCRVRCRS